ncbi:thrombospondin type 3 repeat-containing protein [Pseudomonadales bacterium]|nr:thrombospondin type 3 repeat-containing protein [Pseudomonadales bacterium]
MSNLLRLVACLFVLLSFNVFAVDTDGDGFSDADEATLGTDPNDPPSPLENKLTASDGAGRMLGVRALVHSSVAHRYIAR